eukprot:122218_1
MSTSQNAVAENAVAVNAVAVSSTSAMQTQSQLHKITSTYKPKLFSLRHILWVISVLFTIYDFTTDIIYSLYWRSFTICAKFKTCSFANNAIHIWSSIMLVTSIIGFIAGVSWKTYQLTWFIHLYKKCTSKTDAQNTLKTLFNKEIVIIIIPFVAEDISSLFAQATIWNSISLYDAPFNKNIAYQALATSIISLTVGFFNLIAKCYIKKYWRNNKKSIVWCICIVWTCIGLVIVFSVIFTLLVTSSFSDEIYISNAEINCRWALGKTDTHRANNWRQCFGQGDVNQNWVYQSAPIVWNQNCTQMKITPGNKGSGFGSWPNVFTLTEIENNGLLYDLNDTNAYYVYCDSPFFIGKYDGSISCELTIVDVLRLPATRA